MSTTAAKPAGTCWRCGGQLYENLVHACTTSVAIPVPLLGTDPAYEAATGDLARLIQAAKRVADGGHRDTCDLELGLSAAYPCSCGIDNLRLALLAYEPRERAC